MPSVIQKGYFYAADNFLDRIKGVYLATSLAQI